MINNVHRRGNFTSSQCYRLVGAAGPAKTYIRKKNIERRVNRSIEADAYSQSMAWGTFLEQRVHNLLGMEWELVSEKTDLHPTIPYWAGSTDLRVAGVKIADAKCFQLENFCEYTDVLLQKNIEILKKEYPAEYWQLVSNAIINQVPIAEAISYCPYVSEIDEICQMALDYSEIDAWKYRFIYEKPESLPQLEDGGYYKNLNRFEFEVPQSDIDLLTEKVQHYGKELVPFHKIKELVA